MGMKEGLLLIFLLNLIDVMILMKCGLILISFVHEIYRTAYKILLLSFITFNPTHFVVLDLDTIAFAVNPTKTKIKLKAFFCHLQCK